VKKVLTENLRKLYAQTYLIKINPTLVLYWSFRSFVLSAKTALVQCGAFAV